MDKQFEFAKNAIKGKIAEMVFEFMFRSAGEYTVIPCGYEYSHPELAQYLHLLEEKNVLDTLRHTPDFILISQDRKEVYFVEVKYRNSIDKQQIQEIAESVVRKWDHSYLFIATPQGFFYEPCNTIINKCGEIGELYESHVSKNLQTKYLELLNTFEK